MPRYCHSQIGWVVNLVGASVVSLGAMTANVSPREILTQNQMTMKRTSPLEDFSGGDYVDRIYEYNKTILSQQGQIATLKEKWSMAESFFGLQQFAKALPYYRQIFEESKDPAEKEEASFRIIESELLAQNLEKAIAHFKALPKNYQEALPKKLAYALGKALFDKNDPRARDFLNRVDAGDYFLRARYLLAVMNLGQVAKGQSIKSFEEISKAQPNSLEDRWVQDLALLAQARIYADAKDFDRALSTYRSISQSSGFYETATAESIKVLLYQRDLLLLGLDRFAKLSVEDRNLLAKDNLDKALDAIFNFSKWQKIDWRNYELLSMMASLMVKARRYQDAKLAYDELIEHYRPIRIALRDPASSPNLWSYFAVNGHGKNRSWILIDGVPPSLFEGIADVKEIIALRDRIEASASRLRQIEEEKNLLGKSFDQNIERARINQRALETAYREAVLQKQHDIKKQLALRLDNFLAEAEYGRAEAAIAYMRDIETQLGAIQEFNRENNNYFNAELKKQRGDS